MEKVISFSLLPLTISLCICMSFLPKLIAAHQTNVNIVAIATNMIEKACQQSPQKEDCIAALKATPKGTTEGLKWLAEIALKVAYNSSEETMDNLSSFIEHNKEGEDHWQLLFGCAMNYFEARGDLGCAIEYLHANDCPNLTAKVNHANELIKTCEEKIKSEPGHPHSLFIHHGSKVFRRVSNFALVITRLSADTRHVLSVNHSFYM